MLAGALQRLAADPDQDRQRVSRRAACVRYSSGVTRTEVEVNPQGRVTIPAQMRAELGLTPGARMIAYIEDGRLVLEDRAHLLARIQDQVMRAAAEHGHTGSAVDELLTDRRAEAAREHGQS